MWKSSDAQRLALTALQDEIASFGWYSILWRRGETWQLYATTDYEQFRAKCAGLPPDTENWQDGPELADLSQS